MISLPTIAASAAQPPTLRPPQFIFEVIRDVSQQGITILLVEQNAKLALQAAHRGYVMDSGAITMSGNARDMLNDPRVQAAYLGE